MNKSTFLSHLRRGLGSAIVELRENPDVAKYHDILMRCCLKDIGYDIQTEGTKGYYLYQAICMLGTEKSFLAVIIEAYLTKLPYGLFMQLTDILCFYADDGFEEAKQALHDKYEMLVQQLSAPKKLLLRYDEREQLEYLMICMTDRGKWTAFQRCIADAGRISLLRCDDLCSDFDWFLCHGEDLFGRKRVERYLEKASKSTPEVNAFAAGIREGKMTRAENGHICNRPQVTMESYIAIARKLEYDPYAYARMAGLSRLLSRQTNTGELRRLAFAAAGEPSDDIRANLLRIFRYVDYPDDLDALVKYAGSGHERLRETAIEALARFHNDRIHHLAVGLIERGEMDNGLLLLVHNWRKQDDAIIKKHLLKSRIVSHAAQMHLLESIVPNPVVPF